MAFGQTSNSPKFGTTNATAKGGPSFATGVAVPKEAGLPTFRQLTKKKEKEKDRLRKAMQQPSTGSAPAVGGAGVASIADLQAQIDALAGGGPGGGFATLADVAQAQSDAEAAAAAALAAHEAVQAALDAAQDAAAAAEEAADTVQEAETDAEQAVQDADIDQNALDIAGLQAAVIVLQDALNTLSTAYTTHLASIGSHDDVSLTGIDPGDLLQWTGSMFVPVKRDFQTTFDATDWLPGDPRTLVIPASMHELSHTAGKVFTVDVTSPTGRNCEVDYETDILTGDVTLISRGDSFDGIVRIF